MWRDSQELSSGREQQLQPRQEFVAHGGESGRTVFAGGVGQRMIAGAARRTAGKFFAAVDRELAVGATAPTSPAPVGVLSEVPPAAAVESPGEAPRVWTRPVRGQDPERKHIKDLILAAGLGAGIALLGVLLGAIVARW